MKKVPSFLLFFWIAFVFNLIWEFAHARLYISSFTGSSPNTWTLILAAFLDAIILAVLLYFARRFKYASEFFIVLSGLLIAIIIEIFALQTGLWSYTVAMPIIPILGTGLTPTIQLAITGLISFRITKFFSA